VGECRWADLIKEELRRDATKRSLLPDRAGGGVDLKMATRQATGRGVFAQNLRPRLLLAAPFGVLQDGARHPRSQPAHRLQSAPASPTRRAKLLHHGRYHRVRGGDATERGCRSTRFTRNSEPAAVIVGCNGTLRPPRDRVSASARCFHGRGGLKGAHRASGEPQRAGASISTRRATSPAKSSRISELIVRGAMASPSLTRIHVGWIRSRSHPGVGQYQARRVSGPARRSSRLASSRAASTRVGVHRAAPQGAPLLHARNQHRRGPGKTPDRAAPRTSTARSSRARPLLDVAGVRVIGPSESRPRASSKIRER
jgi:hypothetical protein